MTLENIIRYFNANNIILFFTVTGGITSIILLYIALKNNHLNKSELIGGVLRSDNFQNFAVDITLVSPSSIQIKKVILININRRCDINNQKQHKTILYPTFKNEITSFYPAGENKITFPIESELNFNDIYKIRVKTKNGLIGGTKVLNKKLSMEMSGNLKFKGECEMTFRKS